MSIAEKVPGAEPGSTGRNAVVGVVYGAIVLIGGIPLIAFAILLSPFIIGIIVGKNYWDTAEQLSGLPGIDPEAGLQSGVVAFVGVFLLLSLFMAVVPGDDGGDGAQQAGATPTPTPDNVEQEQTEAAETQEQADTEAPTETETPEPADTPTPEPTPTEEEEFSDEESLQAIETVIESYDITVESVEREGDTIQLSYSSSQTTQSGIAEEMGYVSGAYAGAVAEGESADRMDVEVYTVTGELAGTYHVEREWAIQFNNDEISNTEFAEMILQTLEAT